MNTFIKMKPFLTFRVRALVVALLFGSFVAVAQDIEDTPLNTYLKMAAENNPELQSIFNQYLAAIERLPQAKALPDPVVIFNIFASPLETRVGAQQAGVALSQAFPWFGQLKSQEMAAAQLAKARFELFEDTKNKLFFDVRATYYDYYVLEAAIRITEENIELLYSFRELANIKLESAKGSAVDLLRVEMDLAELINDLALFEDSRLPIQTKFKELLNTDVLIDIQIPDTLLTNTPENGKDVLLDSIITQNPSLREIDFEILALENEIDVARKMGLPSFNLGLNYVYIQERSEITIPDNGKNALILPQIGVKIPLYRKKYRAMVKEQEFLKTSRSDAKEDRVNRLTTDLEQSWRDYLDSERRVTLYIYLTSLASQSLDILVAEYTSASTDFEEILRMDQQLLRYELELEKARADQNTSVAFMSYLTGKNY